MRLSSTARPSATSTTDAWREERREEQADTEKKGAPRMDTSSGTASGGKTTVGVGVGVESSPEAMAEAVGTIAVGPMMAACGAAGAT